MKRFIWLTLCLCVTVCAIAQKQTVIVRTIERPLQKSTTIKGATVKINGYPNTLVSGKGGKFTFAIQGKKQGEKCFVTSVTKKDYTLVDKLPVFAYSYSTPAEIVMVSNKQLQQEEKRIRDKGKKEAEARYNKRIADLERQIEEKTISEESYREQLQQIFDGHENFLKLIDEMARRYAMTDYKGISDINRQIQECIENAEFERANSLINSKGDMGKRKQEVIRLHEENDTLATLLKKRQEEAEFKKNDLAQDFYNKYYICATNYDNDSAAYYLMERASLDTTNVEWLNDAGLFIDQYLANYDLALKYYQRGLRQALAQYGEESEWTARFYNNVGNVLSNQKELSQALRSLQKSLNIRERILSPNHPDIANSFNNLGEVYSALGDNAHAMEYYKKALSIKEKIYGADHLNVTIFYNNIGAIYDEQGDFPHALEYYKKALSIREHELGTDNCDVATSYNNLGVVYVKLGDFARAMEYYQKALSIYEHVYGFYHSDVALSYHNIGAVYSRMGDKSKALEYYQKSISIKKHLWVKDHPDIADDYHNIGTLYLHQGDIDHAAEYYLKTLSIYENYFDLNNPKIADIYNSLGVLCERRNNFSLALDYYQKALSIRERSLGVDNPDVADSYNNLGSLYYRLNDIDRAKDYFEKSLSIKEKIYDADNYDLAYSYNNLGAIYEAQGNYSRALEYYQKALSIFEQIYGTNHREVATSYNNFGTLFYHQGDFVRAMDYYQKSLKIREHVLDSNSPDLALSYNNIGQVYLRQGDHDQALGYFKKSWSISEKNFGPDSNKTRKDRWDFFSCLYNLALKNGTVSDFLLEHCFTATVTNGDTPAKQQGMSGEYVLLEYTEWSENSAYSLIEYIINYGNKPSDLVVLKDGIISKHHFENAIGVNFEIKEITREERELINQLYYQWKKEQGN